MACIASFFYSNAQIYCSDGWSRELRNSHFGECDTDFHCGGVGN